MRGRSLEWGYQRMRIRSHHSCRSHHTSVKQKAGSSFLQFASSPCLEFTSIHLLLVPLVGAMAVEDETPGRETAMQRNRDTIAAIIDEVAAKLQKAPARKGVKPSASVAGPSKGAGKEIRTIEEIYMYIPPPPGRV